MRGEVLHGDIEVSTAFKCGAGREIAETSPGYFRLVIPPDPPSTALASGYDYYFCVRLANRTDSPRTITLEAHRPGRTSPLEWQPSRVPLFVSDDFHAWYVLPDTEAASGHEEFRAQVRLAGGAALFVSNSLPCPADRMARRLERLARRYPETASLECIGRSAQDREILCVTVTDPAVPAAEKDRVLVTSGFHPAEADWLTTTAILDAILDDDAWARTVRRNFIVDVIPHANPDGFDLGTNACNAHGVNLYWDFRAADPATAPEAAALWRWLEAHPPQLYLDFHAYVHQLHKDFRPYIRPLADYPRPARPAVRAIDRELVALCAGRAMRGTGTNDPRTPAAQITNAFGSITYPKFHVHLNHGIPSARQLGCDVFRTIVDAALPFRPLYPRTTGARRATGRLNELRRRWEQGGIRHRLRTLTRSTPVQHGVPTPAGPGLAEHWHAHLWGEGEAVAVE